jgi:DNA-binding MarR family transcriptional regulator
MNEDERMTTLSLTRGTKRRLAELILHKGETYEQILERLIEKEKKKKV